MKTKDEKTLFDGTFCALCEEYIGSNQPEAYACAGCGLVSCFTCWCDHTCRPTEERTGSDGLDVSLVEQSLELNQGEPGRNPTDDRRAEPMTGGA